MEPSRGYEPAAIEGGLFASWLSNGYFSRKASGHASADAPPFTIVIPPPNVTGVLHMGHALNNTLQDILVRRARMQGRPTRWIVGTDHAGIATQNKVEQKLAASGLTRFDLGREAFVEACWEWRRDYGSTIIEQLKAMGCSCDYSDERFTMDEGYAKAVRKVFVDWYHDGLVYRGHRIINWCPRCTTALADDEVEHVDEDGTLWHLRYPLARPIDGVSHLVVATTRPETMLGDTGVAVNPGDERYAALIANGAKVRLPLTQREIPVFADEYVDASFGTGAVKVTPAHDPNDFEMGQRHGLEQINVFDENATVNSNGGRFEGMSREQARAAVLEAMEELGLVEKVEAHAHAVGHCYRCDTTIEPWLSDQWFVAMRQLADSAIEAVRNGSCQFHPRRWENVYFRWMDNIRDWCISRQLWWGHRIPVFYCDSCGWQDASETDVSVCPACGASLRQDEDVLDTWFSSQLWPFATYGWPDAPGFKAEAAANYPTSVLSTARDIIFLWVARMVISSLYFMDGQVPFTDVIIHPTVLDKNGNIMSKSRGNGVDPLELIADFGADGMRFGLALQVTGSQDMKFDREKLVSSRNFANKLFNAARFVQMGLDGYEDAEKALPQAQTLADSWILSRLSRLVAQVDGGLDDFDFGAVARQLYSFFWNEFCDWYIEFAKAQLAASAALRLSTQRILVHVLDTALRLLHPFMPFITDSLWAGLPHGDAAPSIMVAAWPDASLASGAVDDAAEKDFEAVIAIVSAVRSARARYQVSPKEPLRVAVRLSSDDDGALAKTLGEQAQLISTMANVASLRLLAPDDAAPGQSSVTIDAQLEVHVLLEGLVDFAKEDERLAAQRAKTAEALERLDRKLANEGFLAKAAAEVIERTRSEAAELRSAIEQIDQQLARR